MAEETKSKWRWLKWAAVWAVVQIAVIIGTVEYGRNRGVPVAVPTVPIFADNPVQYTQTFGWFRDEAAIADNLDAAKTPQFADTPAGKAVFASEDDVYLWRAVRKAAGRPAPWYPNVNQRDVGCCVGCGWKHGIDVLLAVQIANGSREEWKPVSVEVIYGGSRVEVGGGRISGDGSVGSWAAKWSSRYGVVAMAKYPAADLSDFSPSRARLYGKNGVPDDLEPEAKKHPVRNTALVKTAKEGVKAVRQGYPVVVCSDVGFRMSRGADGFARVQGSWAHCMVALGARGGTKPGVYLLNSWGDAAHDGGVFPDDMPVAGFWVELDVFDRMLRQGDSFAISDAAGFVARLLPFDWFI